MIFRVGPCEDGKRLDSFLRSRGVSRRLINSLKHTENGMTRRGETVRTVDRVFAGDEIDLYEPSQVRSSEDTGVPVLYEDEHCIVFSKPPFMPCHRSPKHYDDTLEIEFHKLYPELPMRCINRLDKNTSGCVIAAKTLAGASWLQKSVSKVYVGITKRSGLAGGRICAPIARQEGSTVKRCVRADGKFAATTFKTVENINNLTLTVFTLETGRTHQIRVHCAHRGLPLLGDDLYGGDTSLMKRQALHCAKVSFVIPFTDEPISVFSPMPEDMVRVLGKDVNVKSL
ncbi:MAG: RluA family pseudouridine synthase [Ruminococcus sp.]|nr:RluA family pseudouridine synthase [Ruminococcus sp.]